MNWVVRTPRGQWCTAHQVLGVTKNAGSVQNSWRGEIFERHLYWCTSTLVVGYTVCACCARTVECLLRVMFGLCQPLLVVGYMGCTCGVRSVVCLFGLCLGLCFRLDTMCLPLGFHMLLRVGPQDLGISSNGARSL